MRIYLRPITLEDGKYIVKWRNAPGVSSHCFNRTVVTEASNARFFNEYVVTGKYQQYIVECVDEDYGVASYPIATVYLKDIDRVNRRCELCIFTSDDQEWNSQSQTIAIKLLIDKAFKELNMHKVYSYVFANYRDEIELLKQSGFRVEAILADEALAIDGSFYDTYRMVVFNDSNEGKINIKDS